MLYRNSISTSHQSGSGILNVGHRFVVDERMSFVHSAKIRPWIYLY